MLGKVLVAVVGVAALSASCGSKTSQSNPPVETTQRPAPTPNTSSGPSTSDPSNTGNSVAVPHSKELEFKDTQGNGSVGLVYAYDRDFDWQLTFSSKLSNADIKDLPDNLSWNIAAYSGVARGADLFPQSKWIPKSSLIVGQLRVSERNLVKEVLLKQKTSRVEFRLPENNQTVFQITMARVCTNYAGNVQDLTHPERKACDVEPKDLGDEDICKASESEIRQWLKDDLITCDLAKSIHKDRGCGEFNCQ